MVLSVKFTENVNNVGLFTFINDTDMQMYKDSCIVLSYSVLFEFTNSLNNAQNDNFKLFVNSKDIIPIKLDEYSNPTREFAIKNCDMFGNLVFINIDSFIKCITDFVSIGSFQISFVNNNNKIHSNYARIPIVDFRTELNICGSFYANVSLLDDYLPDYDEEYVTTSAQHIKQIINNLKTVPACCINVKDNLIISECICTQTQVPLNIIPIQIDFKDNDNIIILSLHDFRKILKNGVIFHRINETLVEEYNECTNNDTEEDNTEEDNTKEDNTKEDNTKEDNIEEKDAEEENIEKKDININQLYDNILFGVSIIASLSLVIGATCYFFNRKR